MRSKAVIRTVQKLHRAELPDVSSLVCGHLKIWLENQNAKTVLAYKAFSTEISLEELVQSCPQIRFLTTRVHHHNKLSLHDFALATVPNRYSILEPPADAVALEPALVDVALVPGLAFTQGGARLGYGAGFYDRLLPQLRPDCALVGVTHNALLLPKLPLEPTDIAMTHLALESGIFVVALPSK